MITFMQGYRITGNYKTQRRGKSLMISSALTLHKVYQNLKFRVFWSNDQLGEYETAKTKHGAQKWMKKI